MTSSGEMKPNEFGAKQSYNTSDAAAWNLPPPYIPNNDNSMEPSAPPSPHLPYGTVHENNLWQQKQNNDCCSNKANRKSIWIFLEIVALFLFLGHVINLTSLNWPIFGRNLYDWEALPKDFNFESHRFLFQTVGDSLSEGHIQFLKAGPNEVGRVELRARITHDLIDNPELTYHLTHDNDSTTFEIHIPRRYEHGYNKHYIRLDANIYVPSYKMDDFTVRVQNTKFKFDENDSFDIESLLLSSTNSGISFDSKWQGKQFVLKSTNGRIEVNKSLLDADTVELHTSNGAIKIKDTIQANKEIKLVTTNGGIDVKDALETVDLKATTSNSAIHIYQISAETAIIETTNGQSDIKHAHVSTLLRTKTTNSRLDVNVEDCQYCQVTATTSNAGITARLPADHEGPFSIQTSRGRHIAFEDDLNWSKIQVRDKSSVRGERYNPNEEGKKGGRVVIQTTNADATVLFTK